MNKTKLFIENFVVYGLGGIISKLIPLIMLPYITSMMPSTEYFGLSDLTNTLYSLCASLAGMGLYDAMYRLFFEKQDIDYQKEVCSTALNFCFLSSLMMFFFMVILRTQLAYSIFGSTKYVYLVIIAAITTVAGATNALISAPTRMQNKRVIYILMNLFTSIVSYSVTILMLYKGMYLYALPIGIMISTVSTEIFFFVLNKDFFSFKLMKKEHLLDLLKIGLPLLPNSIIYWIFNSCDRMMITNFIGPGASGIYAVGAKIGSTSQLIYIAFSGCWQYFAFYTMKEKNQVENNSKIYEYLAIFSFIGSILIFQFSSCLYSLFFGEQYYSGYVVAPYLFLAPLLQMLLQVSNSQLVIIKNTKPNIIIMSAGAITNIALNYILIPRMGIEGAAIATLTGYIVSNIFSIIILKSINQIIMSKRIYFSAYFLLLYIVLWHMGIKERFFLNLLFSIGYIGLCLLLYKSELINLSKKLRYAIIKENIS